MTEELTFLINTVKEASKIITNDFNVKAKGNKGDLVTNFDYEIERFILDKIKIIFFSGGKNNGTDEQVMSQLRKRN